ncbi:MULTISPECIES: hypothetical protein [Nitrospirillum]|uniref:hypothetical protein n=1 Tax=Nitrospirillum amazonense TaxID=28077 RepID=UPI0011A79493|nr:hypothetical protein [Nitrospirillum amazonense]MEC4593096.1 hypothetical protein [Nitrospirillum amazonense]
MKIDDDHMYYGAALLQIAEDRRFTAINPLVVGGIVFENFFRINDNIIVSPKYCIKPKKPHSEYQFGFSFDNIESIKEIKKTQGNIFFALVCVEDRQICCLSSEELFRLIEQRIEKKGNQEDKYIVLVTVKAGESMRVYLNAPGVKNTICGSRIVVPRNRFPAAIFD